MERSQPFDWRAGGVFAETGQRQTRATLTGKDFELTIDSLPVNFTGRRSVATAVNGSVPGPILRWREGDTVTIAVTNRLPMPASIHWHGMRIPAEMDGVPGLSYAGIAPALLRLAGGCACGYRFRSNARMGRNRHTGTGSVLLEFCANAVCSRRRTRRQPQVELNFYSQADRERGIGTGLSDIDGGVRLGYQFSRKFAPYIGYVYSGVFGQTATFSRLAGQPTGVHQFVFGIWWWR